MLEKISEGLFSGVVSGIIAAGICLLIQRFWKSNVIPWFEDRIYSELSLTGRWRASWKIDEPYSAGLDEITLEQSGHRVSGTIECVRGYDRTAIYKFDGTLKNNVLIATYSDQDKTILGRGSMTLTITKHGQGLQGISAFFDERTDATNFCHYFWERVHRESPATKSQAEEFWGNDRAVAGDSAPQLELVASHHEVIPTLGDDTASRNKEAI